jgi:hypothetical protein
MHAWFIEMLCGIQVTKNPDVDLVVRDAAALAEWHSDSCRKSNLLQSSPRTANLSARDEQHAVDQSADGQPRLPSTFCGVHRRYGIQPQL